MVVKSGRQTSTENLAWQDLFPMAKAKLLELQFPVDTYQISGKSWMIPVSIRTQKVIRAEFLKESGRLHEPDKKIPTGYPGRNKAVRYYRKLTVTHRNGHSRQEGESRKRTESLKGAIRKQ